MKIKHTLPICIWTILLFGFSETNAQDMCIQVIQPAVNAQGECHHFPTPCDVPEGWNTVPDCELVKPDNFGSPIDEIQERREESRWTRLREILREKRNNQREKNTTKVPFGRAMFIKNSEEYQKRQSRQRSNQSYFRQKTYTQPQYNKTEAFERFKELNPQLGGYKRDLTEGERYEQNFINQGRRRPAIQSATEMRRTGYLSSLNKVGVRKFQEPNWENKETVNQFWERPQPERRSRSVRTPEEIKRRLDNRRIRLGAIERDFGIDYGKLQQAEESQE